MEALLLRHKLHWSDADFLRSALVGLLLLVASLVINYYAAIYATNSADNAVGDIILSNIPAYDIDGIFVYGTGIFISFIVALVLFEPKKLPFTIKTIALFVVIRSFFISLTHIGVDPSAINIDSNLLLKFGPGGDLFFSGHTGLPFLMALIYWRSAVLRYVFIATSMTFAVVVLLGHLHYTIDVASAYFITFTIFHIAQRLFPKDEVLFHSS